MSFSVGSYIGVLVTKLKYDSVPGRGRFCQPDPGKAQLQPGQPVQPCPGGPAWCPNGDAAAAGGEMAPWPLPVAAPGHRACLGVWASRLQGA